MNDDYRVQCFICHKWKKLKKIAKVYLSGGLCCKCKKNNVTFGRATNENDNS